MSRKRSSTEYSCSEQANENSDCPIVQDEVTAKRVKLDLISEPSHTTLQDLPLELLQHILVQVVAMEVKGSKMAKRVWKEKTGAPINRLRSVCSLWNDVLETNFFRNELDRTLDEMAPDSLRLEIVFKTLMPSSLYAITTLSDEIFMLYNLNGKGRAIDVYKRNDFAEVQCGIRPPEGTFLLEHLAACSVSNCVYVDVEDKSSRRCSLIRISRAAAEQKFNVSPWITDYGPQISAMIVAANGNVVTLAPLEERDGDLVRTYDAEGYLQHEIQLSSSIWSLFLHETLFQKSNGNLVIRHHNIENRQINLLEIDKRGSVVQQYRSSLADGYHCYVNSADVHGRIMLTDSGGGIELVDSEFNHLGLFRLPRDEGKSLEISGLHYDSERNEILSLHMDRITAATFLTIFRVAENEPLEKTLTNNSWHEMNAMYL